MHDDWRDLIGEAYAGTLSREEALALARADDTRVLMAAAARARDATRGPLVTYSRKVFIPLTRLCRDVCHYCTFATAPSRIDTPYLSIDAVLEIARAGMRAGCHEALFTLGDKPELRYAAAREALGAMGFATTAEYLAAVARAVLDETGLLPHVNPGVMDGATLARLREVCASAGLMLESTSERLCGRGGPHFGSPDKQPAARLETLRLAGELAIPFTSGILIGIGETREERIDALLALRDLHETHGHLQEVIVQNFRAKPGTAMARAAHASLDEHLWSVAVARLVLPSSISVQAPPNLSPGALGQLLGAGIDDWGGVSPVTPDHVNPEAAWPEVGRLARATARAGKILAARLAVYPRYLQQPQRWLDPKLVAPVLRLADATGHAREDTWQAGAEMPVPHVPGGRARSSTGLGALLGRARDGRSLTEAEVVSLLAARDGDAAAVLAAADALRREVCGDVVSYVVTRNINYTNVCTFGCRFCAFSKGRVSEHGRERGYVLDETEVAARAREAWSRGATEVCMQGGIHPEYTGETYLGLVRAVKAAVPGMHVHAFSPLEVSEGARRLGLDLETYLSQLMAAGLGSLPGTAAEILDDEIRAVICPDKVDTAGWIAVMEAAARVGLRATATIMFGHVEGLLHQARHLLRLRELQARSGVFTELVPLPFVHMEAPVYLRGRARPGPTFREALLVHAVARLALHPHVTNVQASWVKMGPEGARACLAAGANDLGGTLMNESITRAAGAAHGQEMTPERLEALIGAAGREPRQRTTLYADAPRARRMRAFAASELSATMPAPRQTNLAEAGLEA
jgi:FO synthase